MHVSSFLLIFQLSGAEEICLQVERNGSAGAGSPASPHRSGSLSGRPESKYVYTVVHDDKQVFPEPNSEASAVASQPDTSTPPIRIGMVAPLAIEEMH